MLLQYLQIWNTMNLQKKDILFTIKKVIYQKNKSVNLDNLSLTTGIGANIETSLKSYVIGKENKSAKRGRIYTL